MVRTEDVILGSILVVVQVDKAVRLFIKWSTDRLRPVTVPQPPAFDRTELVEASVLDFVRTCNRY